MKQTKEQQLKEAKKTYYSVGYGSYLDAEITIKYIKLLEKALTPNWIKLPELPKSSDCFYLTVKDSYGNINVIVDKYNRAANTWDLLSWANKRNPVFTILAWAEIPMPEPFKEDV